MAEHAVCFIFLLTLLEVVVKTKMSIHGNTHGEENDKYGVFYVSVIAIFKYYPEIIFPYRSFLVLVAAWY